MTRESGAQCSAKTKRTHPICCHPRDLTWFDCMESELRNEIHVVGRGFYSMFYQAGSRLGVIHDMILVQDCVSEQGEDTIQTVCGRSDCKLQSFRTYNGTYMIFHDTNCGPMCCLCFFFLLQACCVLVLFSHEQVLLGIKTSKQTRASTSGIINMGP